MPLAVWKLEAFDVRPMQFIMTGQSSLMHIQPVRADVYMTCYTDACKRSTKALKWLNSVQHLTACRLCTR